jgi:predicted ATPase/DNA-binding CsgD family transcriptional regulator
VVILERQAFLEQLDGLLGEAVQGRGRFVVVHGEAGIGKSTLVRAFTAGRERYLLWGNCDPVVPPRPLGPVLDMRDRLGNPASEALERGDRHAVFSAFVDALRADGGPRIVVFEDLQWADEATLELLRVAGRRISQLPAVMVGTFREEEVGADHPLSAAFGDIPSQSVVPIWLPPLSVSAVRELSSGAAVNAEELHRAAAGNPFFVTEVLAAGGRELPVTLRDAVLARVRRLPAEAVRVMRAAAVLGQRSDVEALLAVAGVPPRYLDECVARGLLRSDGRNIEFRHELAQRAVLESIAASERAGLHGRALSALGDRAGAAELAYHAVEAGDVNAILDHGRRAAAQAAALGAHRAARVHYDHVLRTADRLPRSERVLILEARAHECFLIDDVEQAIVSQRAAIAEWHEIGDTAAEGRAKSDIGQFLIWDNQGGMARAMATEGVRLLEAVGPGPDLARAYARLAQLYMVSAFNADAIPWGEKAVALGEQLGEEQVVVHALNTVGSAEVCMGLDEGLAKLEESLRRAIAADLEEDTARAFNNLISCSRDNKRYDLLERYSTDAVQFAAERDLDLTVRCLIGDIAEGHLDRGRWHLARQVAEDNIATGTRSGRQQSAMVLGLLAARQGESGVLRWLNEALTLVDVDGFAGLSQTRIALTEAFWLAGDTDRAEEELRQAIDALPKPPNRWLAGAAAFWAWKLDIAWEPPGRLPEPYALQLAGYAAKAAAAWATIGCPYAEALALLDSDDEVDLRRALDLFLSLDAAPAAAMATSRLRDMGARSIARGPRSTTRSNPYGLSNREVDVLRLLADGLRNAEIAERLVVSAKTVDHHVSAVLAKLGVGNRHEAGRKAVELGLTT